MLGLNNKPFPYREKGLPGGYNIHVDFVSNWIAVFTFFVKILFLHFTRVHSDTTIKLTEAGFNLFLKHLYIPASWMNIMTKTFKMFKESVKESQQKRKSSAAESCENSADTEA